jgi:hypothetical protein
MEKKLFIIVLFSLILVQCVPFPDRYERIQPGKIRTNGFVYEPNPEGAPGDTIRVGMHFAGDTVDSVHLQMSYSHVITVYGSDTVLDVFDLPIFSESNRLPDSLAFSFVVPESTFFLTKAIPQEIFNAMKKALPPSMQAMSQQDMAAFLMAFANLDYSDAKSVVLFMQQWSAQFTGNNASLDSVSVTLGKLVAAFSIPAVIYAEAIGKNGKRLKIKGDFSIRYNRRLQNTPFAALFPVNDPPKVRWIGLCRVTGNDIIDFLPSDPKFAGKYSLSYLYNEIFPDSVHDTIVIDSGYTYYLAADSGMVHYTLNRGTKIVDSLRGTDTVWHTLENDSVIADTSRNKRSIQIFRDKKMIDTTEMETFFYDWQYENRDLDSVTMPLDSLMTLSPSGEAFAQMLPSLDTNLTHARIWTTVYDFLLDDYNRPRAFAFRQIDIYFTYTERYKKTLRK